MPADFADVVIGVDDPDRLDVRRLVRGHSEWSLKQTPPEFSFSVDVDAIAGSGITLFTARARDGGLLGIGGLKELDRGHGEVKTLHTAAASRGRGVGRAVVAALLDEAWRRGYRRVSLETGTARAFLPARALYESAGFRAGAAFGGYANTEHNVCMTLDLTPEEPEIR